MASPAAATPPPAPPPAAPAAVTAQDDIANLQAMFPDVDKEVLESCYHASNRNPNQTLELLLSMSNPDVSCHRPSQGWPRDPNVSQ